LWFVVVSEKPNSGGLHESSRMTGDMLRDPGLAKARKFGFTTNHKARPRRIPYDNPELYPWLLQHKRSNPSPKPNGK